MTNERLHLEIANILNGVAVEDVARLSGDAPADVVSRFVAVMKLVAEYQFVHCVPFFACGSVPEARRERLRVLHVLAAIERWDAHERELMIDLFKGKQVSDRGLDRAALQAVLERTLDALPNYLDKTELPAYFRDRRAFIAAHRSRVVAALERFVSLDNPLIYKRIESVRMDVDNALSVAGSLVH